MIEKHISVKNITVLFIISSILFIGLYCSSNKNEKKEAVVARIGDQVITATDFLHNYEFGFSHLKKGKNKKENYLRYMINEKILSSEGYRLGLDISKRVKQLEQEMKEELLIEALYQKEVISHIKITQDEIEEAINKSKIKWKTRYWVEPNKERAEQLANEMRIRGYSAVVADQLRSRPELDLKPQNFETDYLSWMNVSHETFENIKDLPIGEISDPVEFKGYYYIFQILDIRREGIVESEYKTKANQMKQTIFYQKAHDGTLKYVADLMTPKNIVTKADAFLILANGIEEWLKIRKKDKQQDFWDALESTAESQKNLSKLKSNLNKTLVTFEDNQWDIKEFLEKLNLNVIQFDSTDQNTYRNQLNNKIAVKIRDHFLIAKAKSKNLHNSAFVKNELKKWKDKWVNEEAQLHYTKDISITGDMVRNYFETFRDRYKTSKDEIPDFNSNKHRARIDLLNQLRRKKLVDVTDSLNIKHLVTIDYAVLDSIKTSDMTNKRDLDVKLFKVNTNRLAYPIIDPIWGL